MGPHEREGKGVVGGERGKLVIGTRKGLARGPKRGSAGLAWQRGREPGGPRLRETAREGGARKARRAGGARGEDPGREGKIAGGAVERGSVEWGGGRGRGGQHLPAQQTKTAGRYSGGKKGRGVKQ